MQADHQAQVAFYLTGARATGRLDAVEKLRLQPALFSAYRDLSALRYDFPLVLAQGAPAECIRSLSALINDVLAGIDLSANDGERLQKRLLHVEREIRALLAEGASGRLSALWDQAVARLGKTDESFAASVKPARAALKGDGEVLDCGADTPTRVLSHAWQSVQEEKARRFADVVARLLVKLSELLKADFHGSTAGRSAEHLKAAMGTTFQDEFDFKALSRVLASVSPEATLDDKRRRRIERLLAVLQSQPFYALSGPTDAARRAPYAFMFTSCAKALQALGERRSAMAEVARAVAMAELEVKGEYDEARHEAFFEAWGSESLPPEDHGLFPDYLVCLNAAQPAEHEGLMELLSSGLPVKVLVRYDDLVETSALSGAAGLSLRSRQLADAAIGLNSVYVLQSSASYLYQFRDRIVQALNYAGAALISVYSGAAGSIEGMAPYLAAAAAMESRAFPAFTYDPSAGPDWASRFHIGQNPQPERDWPSQAFTYEDDAHQRVVEDVDFTLVDFLACDPRFAGQLARVPREHWNGSLVSVRECLASEGRGVPEKVPYLLMTDASNMLQKVIVDDRLIQEARRAGQAWRSLQELGGIRNSHAERLLAREKDAWEAQKQREIEALKRQAAAAPPAAAAAAPVQSMAAAPAAAATAAAAAVPAAAPAEAVAEQASDEPYIETPRCTTCEECIRINNRLFVYDGNKQAYIADLKAGTYRELVEAAENCQVSIIHPGKPKNLNEPGLEELMERAELFK
jgi:hypothetical protein